MMLQNVRPSLEVGAGWSGAGLPSSLGAWSRKNTASECGSADLWGVEGCRGPLVGDVRLVGIVPDARPGRRFPRRNRRARRLGPDFAVLFNDGGFDFRDAGGDGRVRLEERVRAWRAASSVSASPLSRLSRAPSSPS